MTNVSSWAFHSLNNVGDNINKKIAHTLIVDMKNCTDFCSQYTEGLINWWKRASMFIGKTGNRHLYAGTHKTEPGRRSLHSVSDACGINSSLVVTFSLIKRRCTDEERSQSLQALTIQRYKEMCQLDKKRLQGCVNPILKLECIP